MTADFCSEYKAQLDIAIKVLDELINELKKQLPPEPTKEEKFVKNVETIAS